MKLSPKHLVPAALILAFMGFYSLNPADPAQRIELLLAFLGCPVGALANFAVKRRGGSTPTFGNVVNGAWLGSVLVPVAVVVAVATPGAPALIEIATFVGVGSLLTSYGLGLAAVGFGLVAPRVRDPNRRWYKFAWY